MRATILIVCIAGMFFALASVVPRHHVALGAVQAVRLPVDVAAQRISRYAWNALPECFRTLNGDAGELTRAFVAVEYVSTSRVEHAVEYVIAQFAQMTGMPLPDLSYGAAQVRPSTLAKAVWIAAPEARAFVDDCASIEFGRAVVESLLEKHRKVMPPEARLIRVIREYTGQTQDRPEHVVHNAIVARLYADYGRKAVRPVF